MSENKNLIRFIDSEYRELFWIPDGGNIRITYPPDDGRGTIIRKCEYLASTHFKVDGYVYHQCEFAGCMERLGARYEPADQLENVEILPFVMGEEHFFTYNHAEDNTCIGHIAGDFGNDGTRFYSIWKVHNNDRDTPEFQTELSCVVYAFRQYILKDKITMQTYCKQHPEAKLPDSGEYTICGFKLRTDTREYFLRCFAGQNAHFTLYAYDSSPDADINVPEIMSGSTGETNMFYRNDEDDSFCIGYLRGDHGRGGNEFWSSWFPNERNSGKSTPEFRADLEKVMSVLRQEVLKDGKSSSAYCYKHPEAMLPGEDGYRFGFKLETKGYRYYIRCTTNSDDYFYVFVYEKSPVHDE